MKVSDLNPIPLGLPLSQGTAKPNDNKVGFADMLKQALGEVDGMQKKADTLSQSFISGEIQDLHQVMLAIEQANLALELTVQVRNKLIEAYQEISRMQV